MGSQPATILAVTSRYTQYEHSDDFPAGPGCLLPTPGHHLGCSCSCSYRSGSCISPRTSTGQTTRPQGICSRQCIGQQPPLMANRTDHLPSPLSLPTSSPSPLIPPPVHN